MIGGLRDCVYQEDIRMGETDRAQPAPRRSMAPILLAVIVLIMAGGYAADRLSKASTPAQPSELDAIAACRVAVRSQLKAPASAAFSGDVASKGPGGNYFVTGKVDAQNSFGAMFRQSWVCRAVWTGSAYQPEGIVITE